MKTKEEIEKLVKKEAEKLHDKSKHEDWDIYHQLVHEDTELIKIGYTQCQEDMKKETFTREELIQCMDKATRWDTFNENEPEYKMNMDEFFDYIIKQVKK